MKERVRHDTDQYRQKDQNQDRFHGGHDAARMDSQYFIPLPIR
jgi:hypothetical protein